MSSNHILNIVGLVVIGGAVAACGGGGAAENCQPLSLPVAVDMQPMQLVEQTAAYLCSVPGSGSACASSTALQANPCDTEEAMQMGVVSAGVDDYTFVVAAPIKILDISHGTISPTHPRRVTGLPAGTAIRIRTDRWEAELLLQNQKVTLLDFQSNEAATVPPPSGVAWREVELTNLASGATFTVSEAPGRFTLVQFVDYSCRECQDQSLEIHTLYEKRGGDFSWIALDALGVEPAFLREFSYQFRNTLWAAAVGTDGFNRSLSEELGAETLTSQKARTILLCPNGYAQALSGIQSVEALDRIAETCMTRRVPDGAAEETTEEATEEATAESTADATEEGAAAGR